MIDFFAAAESKPLERPLEQTQSSSSSSSLEQTAEKQSECLKVSRSTSSSSDVIDFFSELGSTPEESEHGEEEDEMHMGKKTEKTKWKEGGGKKKSKKGWQPLREKVPKDLDSETKNAALREAWGSIREARMKDMPEIENIVETGDAEVFCVGCKVCMGGPEIGKLLINYPDQLRNAVAPARHGRPRGAQRVARPRGGHNVS